MPSHCYLWLIKKNSFQQNHKKWEFNIFPLKILFENSKLYEISYQNNALKMYAQCGNFEQNKINLLKNDF